MGKTKSPPMGREVEWLATLLCKCGDTTTAHQCLHDWTVGGSGTVVGYSGLSIGAPAVGLMGPDFPNGAYHTPLHGSYSVLLMYFGYAGSPPTLSQTALVPVMA